MISHKVTMLNPDWLTVALRRLADEIESGQLQYHSGGMMIIPVNDTIEVTGDLILKYRKDVQ